MAASTQAIFGFENLSDLDFVPIAGRRSLDHAGLRMTLEGWRSLSLDDRRDLAHLGVHEIIDVARVSSIAQRAAPSPARVEAVPDPDQLGPPEELVRALDASRPLDAHKWAGMRGLDRYALSYVHRRAVARGDIALLRSAYDDILRPGTRPHSRSTSAVFHAPITPPYGGDPVPTPSDGKTMPPQTDDTPTRVVDVPKRTVPPPPTSRSSSSSVPAQRSRRPTNPDPASGLTHVNAAGAAHMVDVSAKATTARRAVAQALVHMRPETLQRLEDAPKGSVLAAARIAGIQAAKKTSELIPLCHMLPLTSVEVDLHPDVILGQLQVVVTVRAVDRTGVEMEALVAASIASLTVYDMLKAIDREIVVADLRLLEKDGGASGSWTPGGGAIE